MAALDNRLTHHAGKREGRLGARAGVRIAMSTSNRGAACRDVDAGCMRWHETVVANLLDVPGSARYDRIHDVVSKSPVVFALDGGLVGSRDAPGTRRVDLSTCRSDKHVVMQSRREE